MPPGAHGANEVAKQYPQRKGNLEDTFGRNLTVPGYGCGAGEFKREASWTGTRGVRGGLANRKDRMRG